MSARQNAAAVQAGLDLTITRLFDAPRALVFKMWAEGEHMNHWSCPSGMTIPFGESDFRPGGAYRAHMRAASGEEYRLQGIYKEIVADERIVMTHGWLGDGGGVEDETLLSVSFVERDGKTEMTLLQTGFTSKASRDGHAAGWGECFDKLANYLETL
jgi:uncharacterized protein YndB with AHSA1/START domain